MAERTVFLVYGYDCYEYPCDPIKVFASEADAMALLAEITAHEGTRPAYPDDHSTDEEYEAWDKRYATWRETHPAMGAYGHDGFNVMPLELMETTHDA